MKTWIVISLWIVGMHVYTQSAVAQSIDSGSENLQVLGRADHFAYIDVNKLPTTIQRSDKGIFSLYNSKLKPESFFQRFNWNLSECWEGSILREGVNAYCLPYLKIGYRVSSDYPATRERFISASESNGVYVWYENKTNGFYMWGSGWNFEYALGPFTGEPLAVLGQTVERRKEKRSYPGVKLEFVSQNWTYPNEPQPPPMQACMTGYCPEFELIRRYHSITTRMRLRNNSKTDLYYLSNPTSKDPVGFAMSRKTGKQDWSDSTKLKESGKGGLNTAWVRFPAGASIEFDLIGRAFADYEYIYAVILNDVAEFWDEFEISTPVPVTLQRKPLATNHPDVHKN